jgi:hypothetical protein
MGSDLVIRATGRRTAREPLNLTLDFQHAHVSSRSHSSKQPAGLNPLRAIARLDRKWSGRLRTGHSNPTPLGTDCLPCRDVLEPAIMAQTQNDDR